MRFAAFILCAALVNAQQSTSGPTTPAPTPAPTTPAPTGGTTTSPRTTAPSPTQPDPVRLPQIMFVTGTVVMADGTEPPDRVQIERLCSTNRVRAEGYTDSKGRFSLQLGQSQQLLGDASQSMFIDGAQGLSTSNQSTSSPLQDPNQYFDCELRAKLPGHRSSSLLLAGHKAMDDPNLGTIVLYPMSGNDGLAISATSAAAPKDAKKAYEKGLSEAKKQKLENAEKQFRKAVELHPKYADAWLELGKTYSQRKQFLEAREALIQAIAADPQYVYPYEQMYLVAFEQANWQELADTTDRLLRLNPYEFPIAYYYHGVAQYQLKNLDAALKSLEQAISADRRNQNPKAHYVMGLVLISKHDYPAAANSLVTFSELAPADPQVPKARDLIGQIEKALQ